MVTVGARTADGAAVTSRARLSRRPLQVGGLLLATVALGTVTAPAASAEVDPAQPVEQAPGEADAQSPQVLTPVPGSYLGSTDTPVDFGMGKLQVYVAPAAGATAPVEQGMAGAQVEVAFPDDADEETGVVPTAVCTTIASGLCVFPRGSFGVVDGMLSVDYGDEFVIRQTVAPDPFALPSDPDDVVHGLGTFTFIGDPQEVESVDGSPSVTPAWQRDLEPGPTDTVGRVTFYDPLVQLSGSQPGDTPVAPGAPAPDSTAPAAPVVPVTPAAAAPAAAAPTLATTGFDAGPAALVGAGLLAAGAGAVVVGRRRAAR